MHANAEALTSYRHALAAVDALRDQRVGGLRSVVRERVADTLDVLGNHREAAALYETALRGFRASVAVPDDLADLTAGLYLAERPAELCRKVAYAHAGLSRRSTRPCTGSMPPTGHFRHADTPGSAGRCPSRGPRSCSAWGDTTRASSTRAPVCAGHAGRRRVSARRPSRRSRGR